MISQNRIFAYHTGPATHLDHLGVLAITLKIPLVTSDPLSFQTAKTFYPELNILLIESSSALDFLNDHCDAILGCGKFWAAQLKDEFTLLFNKQMRIVFCPHGNSDKGRSLLSGHPHQDIALLYGQQMFDLWKKTGVLDVTGTVLFTGNYRKKYYEKHKTFCDKMIQPILDRLASDRKTIFYTPTWPDRENPSPFFKICDPLIEQLASKFNLIIKLHPFFEEHFPAETHRFIGRYENHHYVTLVHDLPLVYPLLNASDIYLGDYSSIGYDALSFDIPLYFIIEEEKTLDDSDLAKVGMHIKASNIENLLTTILRSYEENRSKFRHSRQNLNHYAFGIEKSGEEILRELISCA